MRCLLDTCVALWWFAGDEQITPAVRDMISEPSNEVFFSDVSALEIVIKWQLKKLTLPRPASRLLPALVDQHGFESLPLDWHHISGLEKLPLLHRDPFDRLLIAQALAEKLVLITPDQAIAKYDVQTFWT
jgi:PIN domain nuclease of toxin-antitoxin system